MGKCEGVMMYKLIYVEEEYRKYYGTFQSVDAAIDEINRICREEFKFTAWGNDIKEKDNVTIVEFGRKSAWFEIEEIKP